MERRPAAAMLGDLAVLVAVPVGLLWLHVALPASAKAALSFRHGDPRLFTAWTAAYVHGGWTHLLGNLEAYAFTAFPAWGIAWLTERRRQFFLAVAAVLVVGPPVVTAISYVVLQAVWLPPAPARGFSGLVGAFVGIAYFSAVGLLSRQYDSRRARSAGLFVGVLLLGEVYVLNARQPSALILLAILAGAVLSLADTVPASALLDRGASVTGTDVRALGLATYAFLAVLYVASGLFRISIAGGQFVNVYAHAAGFAFGCLLAMLFGLEGSRGPAIGPGPTR